MPALSPRHLLDARGNHQLHTVRSRAVQQFYGRHIAVCLRTMRPWDVQLAWIGCVHTVPSRHLCSVPRRNVARRVRVLSTLNDVPAGELVDRSLRHLLRRVLLPKPNLHRVPCRDILLNARDWICRRVHKVPGGPMVNRSGRGGNARMQPMSAWHVLARWQRCL